MSCIPGRTHQEHMQCNLTGISLTLQLNSRDSPHAHHRLLVHRQARHAVHCPVDHVVHSVGVVLGTAAAPAGALLPKGNIGSPADKGLWQLQAGEIA